MQDQGEKNCMLFKLTVAKPKLSKHQSLKCTSAVSGAPCTIDGTDTDPRPEVPSLSIENLSPIEGSESDTWRCELQAACHVMLRP